MSKTINGILTSDPVLAVEGTCIVNETWKLMDGVDWEQFTEVLEECGTEEAAKLRYEELIG